MSVYTPIPEDTIATLTRQFDISMGSVRPIQNGVENSNWFVTAEDGQEYVLTLFEERTPDEVAKLTGIMLALGDAGVPVAAPIPHTSGTLYTDYQGKALMMCPRLSGLHPEHATRDMCEHMGEALAKLHDSLSTLTPAADYTLAQFPWEQVRDTQMLKMSADDKKLLYKVWQAYTRVTVEAGDALPRGLTHSDLFLDNTLWTGEQLSGLLDFTEVCEDHLLMDIAITANDFCTDWAHVTFDHSKLDAVISGYERTRSLTAAEQAALPTFLALAAARFWLLRLDIAAQNAEKNRGGDHVLVKSPQLMRDLAAYHFERITSA